MKKIVSLVILFTGTLIYSQENSAVCNKRDKKANIHLKSNSLNNAQIAKTEEYDVHYYSLDLSMTNLNTTLGGTAEIHGTTRVALDSVLFELFNTLTISQIRLNGIPRPYQRNGSAVTVPINAPANQNFTVAIDYNGTPPTAATNPLGGSGMTNASSPSWGNQVTWSLSEPFSAYEWWPCKQSLRDKADSCDVKITVPSTCKAGSNGVLENVVDLGNGTTRYEWKHRHPIDYYLISVSVARYIDYSVYANPVGSAGPVLIQNFIYDNPATLTNFQADIDETVDFIELFAQLYGPYPFQDEKYGHCMAPLSGGMEHQTMTTQGFFTAELTAHELGHQWWGDHITCKSWADIWVNEGFASYSEYLMRQNLYPGTEANWMNSTHNSVKSQAGGSVWVADSLNEGRIFSGRLTYDKGASIIHTMRHMVNNDSLFFVALKQIQNDFADDVASGLDIKSVMESVSGVDLTNFFEEWYFGEGFPTYSAEWNVSNGNLLFQLNQSVSMPGITPFFTTPVNVRITRSGAADTTLRLNVTGLSNFYSFPGMSNVTGVSALDYGNWIVNNQGSVIQNAQLSASDLEQEQRLVIYPNPAVSSVNIETTQDFNELYVHDATGRLIYGGKMRSTFDMSQLPEGSYLFELRNDDKQLLARKIVVK